MRIFMPGKDDDDGAEAAGSRQKQRQHVGTVLANNNETLKKHRDREGERKKER